MLVLAGGAGFVIGERSATPDSNDVDIGFLQDMRTHHEQAVEMALLYIGKGAARDGSTDGVLRLIAKEIAFGQAVEIGQDDPVAARLRRAGGQPSRTRRWDG